MTNDSAEKIAKELIERITSLDDPDTCLRYTLQAADVASDELLIGELERRGVFVPDADELEALHDGFYFYDDQQKAVEAVRTWLRKATGRV